MSKEWIDDNSSELNKELALSLLPGINLVLILMNLGRIILLIVSYWHPNICRYYWYYQLVFFSVRETAPINYGS